MTLEQKAKELARECRQVIQNALLIWEWRDAEEEFCRVILAGMQELFDSAGRAPHGDDARRCAHDAQASDHPSTRR